MVQLIFNSCAYLHCKMGHIVSTRDVPLLRYGTCTLRPGCTCTLVPPTLAGTFMYPTMIKMSLDHCKYHIFVLRIIFFFLFGGGISLLKRLKYVYCSDTFGVVRNTCKKVRVKAEDPMCKLIKFRFSFPAH